MNPDSEPFPTNQETSSGTNLAQELLEIHQQQQANDVLESSIAGLRESGNPTTPEALSTAIIEAMASDPETTKAHLAGLCTAREVGSPYRDNDGAKYKLDATLIELVRHGQLEAAKGLVSSSPNEAKVIDFPLTNAALEPEETEKVRSTIARLSDEKQRELVTALTSKGLDTQSADTLIQTADSPDSAAAVPQKFWQALPAYPDAARSEFSVNSGDIAARAELISGVVDRGLGDYAGEFVPNATKLKDPAERERYLDSARQATDTLEAIEPDGPSSAARQNAIKGVAPFADPMTALRATEAVLGASSADSIRQFAALCDKYPTDLVRFQPDFASALAMANADLRDKQLPDQERAQYLESIARRVRSEATPLQTYGSIRQGLAVIDQDFEGSPDFADRVIRGNQPLEIAQALRGAKPLLDGATPALKNLFVDTLATGNEPLSITDAFLETSRRLSEQAINSGSIDSKSFMSLNRLIEAHRGSEQLDAKVERFCTNWKIDSEYADAYGRGLAPVAESGLASSIDRALKPRYEDMPTLAAEFTKAGLSDEAGRAMFDTWTEFAAFGAMRHELGDKATPEVSAYQLAEVAKTQTEMFASQAEAFTGYCDRFGADELRSVMDTFGIRNFRRYKPDQLHDQLVGWNDGKEPYENVIIAAQSDWNGAIKDVGSELTAQIGRSAVYFEAGDSASLAKDLVAVGNRDRAHGRDPLRGGTVKNLIIHGHANPNSILLGGGKDNNGEIHVRDFITLSAKRARIDGRANDYRQHLGPDFRVILQACSTAGTPTSGLNIAETLSNEHNVEVAGSPFTTKGAFIIEPNGDVTFRTDEKDPNVASVIYPSRG